MIIIANVWHAATVLRRLRTLSGKLARALDRAVANRARRAVAEPELMRAHKEIIRLCSGSTEAISRR